MTKSSDVKKLMKFICKDVEQLGVNKVFSDSAKMQELGAAIEELSNLTDDQSSYHNYGSGPQNIMRGDGTQNNNTNSGPGPGFFAPVGTLNFGGGAGGTQ